MSTESGQPAGEVAARARALLEESAQRRLDAATDAAESARRLELIRAEQHAAASAYHASWAAAIKAGWDPRELERIGLTNPNARPRKRPASRARTTARNGQNKADDA